MGRSLGINIIRDGLVFYLDGASGKCYPKSGTDLNDIIGSIGGTLENGVGYVSNNLGSFVFDGVDDYLKMDINSIFDIDGSNSFTFSSWVLKSGGLFFPIFQKLYYPNASTQDGYRCYIRTGTNEIFVNLYSAGNSNITVSSVDSISSNVWNNIVVTYDGSQDANGINIYLNGDLLTLNIGSNTYSGTLITGEHLTFGGQPTPTNPLYGTGNISNVSLYNKVLSQSEIAQNYNALKYRFV
jgi:archaellum component FlaF (FlaF/FlaG flagellin family)